jgi:hypothetical protein
MHNDNGYVSRLADIDIQYIQPIDRMIDGSVVAGRVYNLAIAFLYLAYMEHPLDVTVDYP